MKLSKYLIALILLSGHFYSNAQQNVTPDKIQSEKTINPSDKIVFLLRQDEHITQAIKTAVDLKSKNISSVHPSETVLIICGESVKNLNSEKMIETLEVACAHNITVYACGLSLKKFGLTKKDLPPSVKYIENGLIKSLELQKQGYLSVEL
jgi:intracellular sulfur oxidation DsrE/DsrF family protein